VEYKRVGTVPMKIHKELVVGLLMAHPEDLATIFPDGPYKTAQEAIEALRRHPGTWFVNGVLEDPNE
jgi:hypothetical protein